MLKKFAFNQDRGYITKFIVIGAIIGGILGLTAVSFNKTGILTVPKFGFVFAVMPFSTTIAGTMLGILFGGAIGSLVGLYITQDKPSEYSSHMNKDKSSKKPINDASGSAKLQLHAEKLDIAKKWIQTGEVTMHKEVFTKEKNITVPVTREELVIEKKVLGGKASNKMDAHTEKIRIPISEERIEVIKHPLVLEDVEIYKHQFQETECIEKTLKKEQVHLETTGDPKVIDKEVKKQ